MGGVLKNFFLPKLDRRFLIRAGVVALLAFAVFKWICIPMKIRGGSMEPTYRNGGFNFCWRPAFLFSAPRRGDVVMVRFSGTRIMLLKRIVAFGGETVEFRDGVLYVDGKALDEPYLARPCDWNIPALLVKEGYVYVVGDNRDVPSDNHQMGQTSLARIAGVPLW